MKYTIKRGEQTFGPYTLADLQKYVQSGNIGMSDLTQSEGMSDWAPVSQVIGNVPIPTTAYGAAAAPAMEPVQTVPLPPNLHWGVVLAFNAVSRFFAPLIIFNLIWTMVLANWARKLDGNNNTLILVAMYPAGFVSAFMAGAFMGATGSSPDWLPGLAIALILGGVIAYIVGVFKIKAAMETYYNSTEKYGLKLSGVMTFFFSTVYLQYKVNELAEWKRKSAPGILS